MLILTRRAGQSLYVGDSIRVTVLGIQGKQVKIGLELPEDLNVYRDEVYQRVMEENRMAIQISNEDLLTAATLWQDSKK
jgi:carbon storage regulator